MFEQRSTRIVERHIALKRPGKYALLKELNESAWFVGEGELQWIHDSRHVSRHRLSVPKRRRAYPLHLFTAIPVALPPTDVTGLSATPVGETQVNLTWNASTTTSPYVISQYNVYRDGVLVGAPTGTAFSDTGLEHFTSYVHEVEAVDNQPLTSLNRATVTVRTLDQTPPTTVTVTASASQTSLSVEWTAASDTGSGLAFYRVYLNGVLYTTTTGQSLTISGLLPSTEYTVGVAGVDGSLNEAVLATATATTETVTVQEGLVASITFAPGDHLIFRFDA